MRESENSSSARFRAARPSASAASGSRAAQASASASPFVSSGATFTTWIKQQKEKGVHVLLEAARRLPDVRFRLAGRVAAGIPVAIGGVPIIIASSRAFDIPS